jgi:hypothetical protein
MSYFPTIYRVTLTHRPQRRGIIFCLQTEKAVIPIQHNIPSKPVVAGEVCKAAHVAIVLRLVILVNHSKSVVLNKVRLQS